MKSYLNSKGQMFEGYEIIIGVIMGLLMAVIIVSAINYFAGAQQEISHKQLTEGFANALQNVLSNDTIQEYCVIITTPEKRQKCESKLVVEKALKLDPAVYTGKSLSAAFPEIQPECIDFRFPVNSTYAGLNMNMLKINKLVKTNVYFACIAGYFTKQNCPVYCIISMGEIPVFTTQ